MSGGGGIGDLGCCGILVLGREEVGVVGVRCALGLWDTGSVL